MVYENSFMDLLIKRNIQEKAKDLLRDGDCFLCSEDTPEYCHRRLVTEYLKKKIKEIEIEHLV